MKKDLLLPVLLACAVCALFINIGAGSLADVDEASYAEVTRELFIYRDWLTLHNNYGEWFDKPPLYIWLAALTARVIGVNEVSIRYPAALCGLFLLVLVYSASKRLFGVTEASLAFLILLSSVAFYQYSRQGMMETLVALLIYLAVYWMLFAVEGRNYLYPFFVFSGLLFMTKNVIAVLPFTALAAHIALKRDFKALLSFQFWAGLLLFLLIALPWHLHQHLIHGKAFLNNYLYFKVISRAVSGIESHGAPFYYYAGIFLYSFLPWTFFVIDGVRQAFKKRTLLVLLIFCACVLVLFSVSKSKLSWYIFPVYPACAIFCAASLVKFSRQTGRNRLITAAYCINALLFAALLAGLVYVMRSDAAARSSYGRYIPVAAWYLLGNFLACAAYFIKGRKLLWRPVFPVLSAAVALSTMIILNLSYNIFDANPAVRDLSGLIRQQADSGKVLAAYGFESPAAMFYSGVRILNIMEYGNFIDQFKKTETRYALLRESDLGDFMLAPGLPACDFAAAGNPGARYILVMKKA